MSDDTIQVHYNQSLGALASLLSTVKRPGDFYSQGSRETALPRLEIEGVGVISFPLHPAHAAQIISQATKAPYGRGEATLLDPTVRDVWQISTRQVRLAGKAWAQTFSSILTQVARELGCEGRNINAELYKVLLYETGGLFKPHRDTEKAPGMFGTLVVTLPSEFKGGELVLRHASRTISLPMTINEPSEVAFAAFYADCEHEVLPILSGHRLCLVYNLIDPEAQTGHQALKPPHYEKETKAAAGLLRKYFESDAAPTKVAYLLEHQYTPASLSFSTLKNGDAALAALLHNATRRSGCAAYLAIVHIKEQGSADVPYVSRSERYRGYSRENRNAAEQEAFTVIEISEREQYVADWKCLDADSKDFGKIPLKDDELMPAGALNGEKADEARVHEATGNEGASFERAYHRAAVILWPEDREFNVLLQVGAEAAVVRFEQEVKAALAGLSRKGQSFDLPPPLLNHATAILEKWRSESPYSSWRDENTNPARRSEMLRLLTQINQTPLIADFIEFVLLPRYDGSENRDLIAAFKALDGPIASRLCIELIEAHAAVKLGECVELLKLATLNSPSSSRLAIVIATAISQNLARLNDRHFGGHYDLEKDLKEKRSYLVKQLSGFLRLGYDLQAFKATEASINAIIANPIRFRAENIVTPTLVALVRMRPTVLRENPCALRLWQHAVDHLLQRSEFPPAPPENWARPAGMECRCAYCHELTRFLAHPVLLEHRFRMAAHDRMHVEHQIRNHSIDLDCTTSTKSSPHTLICTKNKATFGRLVKQHTEDVEALRTLLAIAPADEARLLNSRQRITQALNRTSQG